MRPASAANGAAYLDALDSLHVGLRDKSSFQLMPGGAWLYRRPPRNIYSPRRRRFLGISTSDCTGGLMLSGSSVSRRLRTCIGVTEDTFRFGYLKEKTARRQLSGTINDAEHRVSCLTVNEN